MVGPARVERKKVTEKDGSLSIDTEIVIMALAGTCVGGNLNVDIVLGESADFDSKGRIESKLEGIDITIEDDIDDFFPASSFFNVFFKVDILDPATGAVVDTFFNILPQNLVAEENLTGLLPPIGTAYSGLGPILIELFHDSGASIDEDVDLTETQIEVTDATGFIVNQVISVGGELMKITGILENTLTVDRAVDGTSAANHQNGAAVGEKAGSMESHPSHTPSEKTLSGPSFFDVQLNCEEQGTHIVTVSAVFTGEDKQQLDPVVDSVAITCGPPIPRMSKSPALQNVFLTRQGAKIPPSSCLAGKGTTANVGQLAEGLTREISEQDPKNPSLTQQLAAFEFEVHYDNKKVCIDINVGAAFEAAGAVCIVEDDQPDSKPQLEGVARIGCVTIGKGHDIDNLVALASVDVYPQPEIYSQAKPNQDNGVVVQISNVNCDLSDEQGHAIKIFSCDDADITVRYLEGDVEPDCVVDAMDAQAVAFRWGVEKGSTIYTDFMNLEPSGQQQDNDIDVNDLQFVYGRFGSTCEDPHPPQLPVNPKA